MSTEQQQGEPPVFEDWGDEEGQTLEPEPESPQVIRSVPLRSVPPNPLAEAGPELTCDLSHTELAQVFIDRHGANWRYITALGKWLHFNGNYWETDDISRISHEVAQFLRTAADTWPVCRGLTAKSHREMKGMPMMGSVRQAIRENLQITAIIDQWDTDDYLLGTPTGTIDLRTGKLRTALPQDYITKQTAVSPQRGACPLWESFLQFLTCGDQKMYNYLKRAFGAALTGDRTDQVIVFLYGQGQNGKGTFLRMILEAMGSYATTAPSSTFMQQSNEGHPTEMADLLGKRVVIVDEVGPDDAWNERRIKQVTGGLPIKARYMARDFFSFMPKFFLMVAGNHSPAVRGVGKGMSRRLHKVPCNAKLADKDKDEALAQKMRAELPQILAWALEGHVMWQQDRLTQPESVREASDQYMSEQDHVADWIEERCKMAPNSRTARTLAYNDFKAWALKNSVDNSPTASRFYEEVENKGYGKVKIIGTRYIVGLELAQSADEPARDWRDPD